MEQGTYSWLKNQINQLIAIINRQVDVNRQIDYDTKSTQKLTSLIERLSLEDFKVLIMGTFSSGKSTFINSLLGQRILPAKMLPSTACICTVRYAEIAKCTLHPRNNHYVDKITGKIHQGPFEINLEDLKNYIVIDHNQNADDEEKASKELYSPFELMELEWPVGICKDGVEIIDSPGLNDPNSHDKITLEYLPKTDAVIYCMSCLHAFSKLDKETIQDLVQLGYKSIIFILTNFDRIQDSDEEEEFVATMRSTLSAYTDLGAGGVLFVNSLGAVLGKEKNDLGKVEKSNIIQVEHRLEDYLVSQKGKAKLIRGESQVSSQNEAVRLFIDNKLKLNSLTLDELTEKHEQLSLLLNSAKSKSELMLKTLELGIIDITVRAADMERLFLDSLEGKIEDWVNEYTPSSSISIAPWNIKSSIKTYVNEYIDHIKYRLKQESISWANDVLNPIITDSIKKIADNTTELQKSYAKLMLSFQIEMNLDNINNSSDELDPPPIATFGSVLYGVVTGDFIGASLGYTFGFKGLISSLIAQLVAGIIVGIISLFTPVGLIAFIIAAITAAIAAGAWNFNMIPNKVRKTIIEKLKVALSDKSVNNELIEKMKSKISSELNKIVIEAKALFDNDILPKEKAMNDSLALRKKGESEVKVENERLEKTKLTNTKISMDIKSFNITNNL